MSIASAITAAQGKVADAYTAISNKGGTLPATQNLSNMPTAISSIPTGASPVIQTLNVTPSTSAQSISATGGVDGYSPVEVSAVTSAIDANITAGNIKNGVTILGVSGTYGSGVDIPREVSANGVYRLPSSGTFTLPNNVTEIGDWALYYAFYGTGVNCGFTSVSFPAVTTIGGSGLYNTFHQCTALTTASFPALTSLNLNENNAMMNAFSNCIALTSVSMPVLATIKAASGMKGIFSQCSSLPSMEFTALSDVSGYSALENAFEYCTAITNIRFPALTTTSFGSNVNQFNNMMKSTGSNTTHTIHFPSNLETTIQGLTGYPLFGGTSGYVILAFDLPATS